MRPQITDRFAIEEGFFDYIEDDRRYYDPFPKFVWHDHYLIGAWCDPDVAWRNPDPDCCANLFCNCCDDLDVWLAWKYPEEWN